MRNGSSYSRFKEKINNVGSALHDEEDRRQQQQIENYGFMLPRLLHQGITFCEKEKLTHFPQQQLSNQVMAGFLLS